MLPKQTGRHADRKLRLFLSLFFLSLQCKVLPGLELHSQARLRVQTTASGSELCPEELQDYSALRYLPTSMPYFLSLSSSPQFYSPPPFQIGRLFLSQRKETQDRRELLPASHG